MHKTINHEEKMKEGYYITCILMKCWHLEKSNQSRGSDREHYSQSVFRSLFVHLFTLALLFHLTVIKNLFSSKATWMPFHFVSVYLSIAEFEEICGFGRSIEILTDMQNPETNNCTYIFQGKSFLKLWIVILKRM